MMKAATVAELSPESRFAGRRGFELSALWALFLLTLRLDLRGKRLLVLALLFLLPSAAAIAIRLFPHPPPPEMLEFGLVFRLIPHVLATLTALLYATGIIQDEVEEQTLTYLLLRPLPRWALYLTKLAATMLVTSAITGLFTALTLVTIYWGSENLWGEVFPDRAVKIAGLMALAQVGYCSVFGAISLLTRRSMIVGLVYIFTFEWLLASFELVVRQVTVMYYFRVLAVRWLQPEGSGNWAIDLTTAPSSGTCVLTILIASGVFALLGAWLMMTREFRVKTPEGS
jgi:ABC-2 type transport system permease protein